MKKSEDIVKWWRDVNEADKWRWKVKGKKERKKSGKHLKTKTKEN